MKYFIIFFLSLGVYSQDNVKGLVLDGQGAPIEGSIVRYINFPFSTITDHQGRFELDKSQVFNDTLVISYVGYSVKKIACSSIDNANLIVSLKPSAIELEEVIIKHIQASTILDSVIKYHDKNTPDIITYYGNYIEKYSIETSIMNYLYAPLQIETFKNSRIKNRVYVDLTDSFMAKFIPIEDGYISFRFQQNSMNFNKKWFYKYLKRISLSAKLKTSSYTSSLDEKEVTVLEYRKSDNSTGYLARLYIDHNYAILGFDEYVPHPIVNKNVNESKYKSPQSVLYQTRYKQEDGKYFLNSINVDIKGNNMGKNYNIHSSFRVIKICKNKCDNLPNKIKSDILINQQIGQGKISINKNIQSMEEILFLNSVINNKK